ncbi:SLC13 family permease [Pseudobacteriovorax antillogorgiicola]|nr:DASS family sodium-coupled anion symporter [Pseudobacteriovorax antillogorgiicola]
MAKINIASWLAVLFSVILLLFPSLSSLEAYQGRMLAIMILAVVLWISELIPVYATGLLIICLQLIFLSDRGLKWLVDDGAPLAYQDVMANFASPIVILFLGGFSLASAANKYKIDRIMAHSLLKPFGTRPRFIMLGMMVITALFSMFMSNTATTAMMLAILSPVLAGLPEDEPSRKGFLLSVPLAANVGGIGTPIGTPPNAVALKYLSANTPISFGSWMAFGIPLVILFLTLGWWWLNTLYKPATPRLELKIERPKVRPRVAMIFYGTFASTIFLWLTSAFHGLNSYIVASIPLTIFFATGILDKGDIKKFNWEVLWLIAGGIALGQGMADSGLSQKLIELIPTAAMSIALLLIVFSALAYLMANFISNTATANLLLPLVATVVTGFQADDSMAVALVQIALVCSFGMAFPISTPPNALAYSTGLIDSRDLLKTGGFISVLGLIFVTAMGYLLL